MRFVVLALCAACSPGPYRCESPDQCVRGDDKGFCQPQGFCSFADVECETGHRFDDTASDDLAGTCVPIFGCIAQVALGDAHTCIRLRDGALNCWGANGDGQVGNGSMPNQELQQSMTAGILDATDLDGGARFTCAVRGNGDVSCWGQNVSGKLGDASMLARQLTPVRVMMPAGERAISVTAGENHACALTEAGAAFCWGENSNGQLGNNSMLDSLTPVRVMDPGVVFVEIHAGQLHTCARDSSAAVWCWGSNARNQLGRDVPAQSLTPIEIVGIAAEQIVVGDQHGCARIAGQVQCWGDNADGELGLGDMDIRTAPILIPALTGVEQLEAGGRFTCARIGGEVSCWGRNFEGQLGDTTMRDRPVPGPVRDVVDATTLVTGGTHSCVRRPDDSLQCWGNNASAQSIIGTDEPLRVLVGTSANVVCP